MDSGGRRGWNGDCCEKLQRVPAQPRTSGCRQSGAPHGSGGSSGRGDEEEGDVAGRKGRGLGGEEGGGCKTWDWGAGPREAKAMEVTARGQPGVRAGGCGLGSLPPLTLLPERQRCCLELEDL